MVCQRVHSSYRPLGLLTVVSLGAFTLLLALPAGVAVAGDVASSEAHGELGLGAARPETAVSEAPPSASEGGEQVPWLETAVYLVVASLIFAVYAVAARKVPWLRPLRLRKP